MVFLPPQQHTAVLVNHTLAFQALNTPGIQLPHNCAPIMVTLALRTLHLTYFTLPRRAHLAWTTIRALAATFVPELESVQERRKSHVRDFLPQVAAEQGRAYQVRCLLPTVRHIANFTTAFRLSMTRKIPTLQLGSTQVSLTTLLLQAHCRAQNIHASGPRLVLGSQQRLNCPVRIMDRQAYPCLFTDRSQTVAPW